MSPTQTKQEYTGTELAVVGMACRFPGARNLEEFWNNLRDGVHSLTLLTDEEMLAEGINPELLTNPNYVKAGLVLEGAELFDAAFFGYNPREAEVMDPQQRIFLECAWEALEDAGYDSEKYKGSVGVYAGTGMNTYILNFFTNPEVFSSVGGYQTIISNDKDFLATRVSYKLNLRGPSFTVQTACSTSLVAIHLAGQSLLNGECDMALAGGVSIRFPQKAGYMFHPEMIHSPDGHCRAFDAKAQGPGGGAGAGAVVLKRLADALADGDHVYAVVRGSAVNNDGAQKVGYTAPSVNGQARVITEALAVAGVDPSTITFVEAHGTGTALGDPIEIAALTSAYRAHTQEKNFCAVGSVKSNIGHTDTAAGAAGFIKTVLALKHGQIPASLHFEEPNPKIDFANSPFFVNPTLREWQAGPSPRRAAVSSFGMGGTNAHVILEEAPPQPAAAAATRPWQVLVLSAKSRAALDAATTKLADYFERHPELDPADAAYTLQVGRATFSHRRTVVCRDLEDAAATLRTCDPQRVFTTAQEAAARPVAFMFPGGGAQYAGMGRDLYTTEAVYREHIDRCLEILERRAGVDVRHLLYPSEAGEAEASARMERTSVALPALFATEYALARLLMSWGVRPRAMIGHSLGEYVAACLAGVFSLEDALELVALRGKLFERLPEGSMLSVALSERELEPFLGKRLSLAAINGPSLCVVSGPADAIDEMERTLADRGVEVGRLHIAVAAHSEMVEPILEEFAALVRTIKLRAPKVPFVSNLSGDWITEQEATDPDYWVKHLRHTVRFGDGLGALWKEQEMVLLEVGPGQTLTTLARQHPGRPRGQSVLSTLRHPQERQHDVPFLLNTVGKLWLAGAQIEWSGLHAGQRRRRVPLPTYPFESQRYWIEARPQGAGAQTHAAPGGRREPADWYYLPAWRRSLRPSNAPAQEASEQQANWLVFADAGSFGERLAAAVRSEQRRVVVVEAGRGFERRGEDLFTLDPSRPEDYAALLRALGEDGRGRPRKIVHAWGASPFAPDAPDAALLAGELARGFHSLIALAQALGREGGGEPTELVVVTSGVQDVAGDEAICPPRAAALGPCLVIPQEYPNVACRSIDIVPADAGTLAEGLLVEQVAAELLSAADEQSVAFRGPHRWVQSFEPARLSAEGESAARLREGGTYLIVGGCGGVGSIFAEHLARSARAKLVLTGRKPLPEREGWAEWLSAHGEEDEVSRRIRLVRSLEEAGAEVLVEAADVANFDQMRRVLERTLERFGALDGVIHAAGADKSNAFLTIYETGREEGEWFNSKVRGLLVLEEVLRGRNLDFCLLTSSLSSILGGLGHAAYSASNHFMDAFARRAHQRGDYRWTSVNWEGWRLAEVEHATGVAAALLELSLKPAEGTEALRTILSAGPVAQVAVSTGDLGQRVEEWVRRRASSGADAARAAGDATLHPRPALMTEYVAPETELQREIVPFWQQLIGVEEIGIHDNFFELGGSSLLATQLISRLRDKFQVELTLRTFFDSPTVAGLATAVEEARAKGAEPPPPVISRIPRQARGAMLTADGVLDVPEHLKVEILRQ